MGKEHSQPSRDLDRFRETLREEEASESRPERNVKQSGNKIN